MDTTVVYTAVKVEAHHLSLEQVAWLTRQFAKRPVTHTGVPAAVYLCESGMAYQQNGSCNKDSDQWSGGQASPCLIGVSGGVCLRSCSIHCCYITMV